MADISKLNVNNTDYNIKDATARSDKTDKSDLTAISITGTKNNTGSTITINKFFYLNGELVIAKTDIADNATLTENTNYIKITAGILNGLYNVLQDVTPTSSDKLLVVQSQGQGLVPYGSKLDSANPTGTGALSINRKSGTTTGENSVAVGTQVEASGVTAVATGNTTTASGNMANANGYGTVANHRSQFVFGEWNTADASTAASTAKGNYIEIVGKGTSNANRSNARTLDWSGNEVLAGDLTYNGNVSLTRLLNQYYFKPGSPIVISGLSRYETFIVMGFAQSIGTVVIMVTISAGTLDNVINMKTGSAFSNSHLTFTYSATNNTLTITSDNTNESRLTVIRG